MKFFWNFVRQHKYHFTSIVFLILLGVVFSLPMPYISKLIVDNVLIGGNLQKLFPYIILVIVIILFQLLVGRLNSIASAHFFQRFLMVLRQQILSEDALESLTNDSNITTVIFNDSELYVTNVENTVVPFISNIGLFLGYLILMSQINISLTFIVLFMIPIYILWMIYVGKKLKLLSYEQQNNRDLLLNNLNTITTNYEVIKIFRLFSKVYKEFKENISSNYVTNSEVRTFQNFIGIISTGIISSTTILIFVLGVFLVVNNQISIGDLIAFNTYSGVIFSPVTQLVNIIATVSISKVYEQRIAEFLKMSPKSQATVDLNNLDSMNLCNLNIFSGENKLIDNINLTFLRGERILLCGENGSGKTLLLKSLVNLYDNYTGDIYFKKKSGVSLKLDNQIKLTPVNIIYLSNNQGFPLKSLREELLSDTVSDKDISNILKDIGLYEKILTLDKGIDTSGQELSKHLSLGELQKLRLARAILYSPKVLILDEILSNVDTLSTRKLLRLLKSKLPTAIIIAVGHHLTELDFFDRVLKIDDNLLKDIN
ncbi:ABC transporter transmembrane domain-containing protein [Streptococcus anginosus]|uniref:ABC transporter transmembrane region n=1 Tax=Streptococcus anginosus subsp. whileyi CCUG 39159 TaxID=1095729 RepID=I0SIL6_STRAP|nr:ABC transporter ATP-binding protein [Streptococcus anginosus]HEN4508404.1 ABC transporter ATP-binding protein [Streptococcus agalactiae]AGU82665.1 ABC transporter, ATP-binding protein [Streptococcus anginosus C238]EID23219.1 ABC transporter transmembrane region [Streptococcus anginosus subsp. whileyi CCUG 39159]MDB8662030.1 ABC transporter ATP-binding protein [Streptococcus anginosus]MDP1385728.1 ABC transporter ATP-binding protein [Streptococcus anginosus]